ncbi:hypothetical protein GJAV_G00245920 [Gymnothorax javanicus]|nr:hypothetical protein GJAV_G00245920 [Gymnothorax javanicus]
MILFSLVVFGLYTVAGMLKELYMEIQGSSQGLSGRFSESDIDEPLQTCSEEDWSSMELPFTNFELAFILIAFVVFSMFSLASVLSQPHTKREEESPREESFKSKSTRKAKQKVIPGASTVKESL